jgi:hypothetical protein
MEDQALFSTASPAKKLFKRMVPKLIPDPSRSGAVIRTLQDAFENGVDAELLPVTLSSFRFDEPIVLDLERLYLQAKTTSHD